MYKYSYNHILTQTFKFIGTCIIKKSFVLKFSLSFSKTITIILKRWEYYGNEI